MIWNVGRIFSDHYKLLKKDSSTEHIVFWLFIFPVITSLFLICIANYSFSADILNDIISFVSLTVGFLITAVIILISSKNNKGAIGDFLEKRTQANVFYTIIIGIALILFIIFSSLLKFSFSIPFIGSFGPEFFISTLILFFLIHFLLNMFVIIKALYALYS